MMRLISSVARAALSVVLAAVLLISVVGGCYWFSLTASLHGLEAGIRERDVIKLEKYIDWPRVREQIRSDLRASVMTHVFKEAKTDKVGGFASSIGALLAGVVAPSMIDGTVDGFITPQSFVRLLAEKSPWEQPELTFAREGFTDFDEYTLLLGTSAPSHPRIRAILRRDGITWRVVRVVFPPGEAPWETNATGLQLGSAKEKIAHQSTERLAGVLDIYKLDVGTYPTTEQGLLALVERPSGITHWNGPYLKGDKVPEDPWGRPFVYHNPSQRPGHEYDLYSLGPNGQPGEAGDTAPVTFAPEAGVTLPDPNPPPFNAKPESAPPPQTATAATLIPAPVPSAEVSAGYRAMLSAWLESHKRYPESARKRGEEGHAVLRFQVDRSGRVLDYTVTSSSGYADLDQAVEEMMRGATLPPFPAGMPQPRMEVSVTIRFSLRR